MELSQVIPDLIRTSDGIWQSPYQDPISYPEGGHQAIRVSEATSFWFQHRLSCLKIIFEKFPSQFILDVGGGNGQVAALLQQLNREVILLEPQSEGALQARGNGIKSVIQGDFQHLALKSEVLDGLSMFDVLEHIADDRAFIQEVHRVLKPGGTLYLTVPAYAWLYSDFDREVGHFRRYTLSGLKELLENEGFVLHFQSYFFSPLPPVVFLLRKLLKKAPKRKSIRKVGHFNKKRSFGRFIQYFLKPELWCIQHHIQILFGSSCLVVARKKEKPL